jgi:glutamate racemase
MRKTTRLLLVFIVLFVFSGCAGLNSKHQATPSPDPVHLRMATFDSGFGGFFTAKSMADQAESLLQKYNVAMYVTHYGDTKNAPYGSKTPTEIANLTQLGVEKAFDDGASIVVIACNTASTQHHAVVERIKYGYPGRESSVLSIIAPTIIAVKKQADMRLLSSAKTVIVIFATPATVKSMAYPTRLANAYQGKLEQGEVQEFQRYDWKNASRQVANFFSSSLIQLPQNKTIFIYQFAPGNWVSMIEQGAPDAIKKRVVQEDIQQFLESISPDHKLDIVGLFCTHYPVFMDSIKNETTIRGYADLSTQFIEQGALAATYAYDALSVQYVDRARMTPITEQELKRLLKQAEPKIVLSGENTEQTRNLVNTIFPELHDVLIVKEPFN